MRPVKHRITVLTDTGCPYCRKLRQQMQDYLRASIEVQYIFCPGSGREVAEHVWLISFMHYDLGFFDDQCNRVESTLNPFSARVLPMSPE